MCVCSDLMFEKFHLSDFGLGHLDMYATKQMYTCWTIPYSGKLSREKTFAFFAISESSAKVLSAKFRGFKSSRMGIQGRHGLQRKFICTIMFIFADLVYFVMP